MSFAADMSKFCKVTAPGWIDGVTRKVVFELAERAVFRSPVGDSRYWQSPAPPGYAGGHFRRNWQYGFGTIPSSELTGTDPSGASAIAAIQMAASGRRGVHYIANTAPYAQRLEEGWSRSQAPFGIVNLIELEFPEVVRRAQA